MSTEPVTIGGAVTALVVAVLALLVGTETLTPELSALVLGIAVAFIALVTVIVRSRVSPVAKT